MESRLKGKLATSQLQREFNIFYDNQFITGSEPVVALSVAVSNEQKGQQSDQDQTHHCGPNDDRNHSLVKVSPALHLWKMIEMMMKGK